jgi:hypothetical protein
MPNRSACRSLHFAALRVPLFRGLFLNDYRCDLAVELVLVWSLTAQREYVTLKYGIQGVRPTVMTIVPLDAGIRLPSYR